jgi:hypothetical protein
VKLGFLWWRYLYGSDLCCVRLDLDRFPPGGDSEGYRDIFLLTMNCAYCTLIFRYDLKLSFCQVDNFAVALIVKFNFQVAMLFFLNELDAFLECAQNRL